jgi:hypothetical protein
MNDAQPYNETKATSTIHGIATMKRALKSLGSRSIDRRTSLGKALDQWRTELIADLGGQDQVSTQELARGIEPPTCGLQTRFRAA